MRFFKTTNACERAQIVFYCFLIFGGSVDLDFQKGRVESPHF